jgi:glycosyltransferase involved in cell wall biosynthesis
MKALIVSNGYPPGSYGGVETYSYDLACELHRRGHQVQVFHRASDPAAPDYTQQTRIDGGIAITQVVNDHKQSQTFRDLYEDRTIHQIFSDVLDTFQPDIVHFNHLLALSVTLPRETARRGIPSLLMIHDYWLICHRVNLVDRQQRICPGPHQGGECQPCVFGAPSTAGGLVRLIKKALPFQARGKLRRLLRAASDTTVHFDRDEHTFENREMAFREALRCANKVVAPSRFVRDVFELNQMGAGKIEVFPLGIGAEPRPRRARHEGSLRFGYVGPVVPLKGLETLLRAFRSARLDAIRLDVYGREDLNPQYAGTMHEIARGDARIAFHGPFASDQRASIYEQMDVLVIPSVWHETFSLVAREALRCGVPVIAARVGALPELVSDGANGFLYPPGDADALAAIIRRIGEQPEGLSGLQIPGPVEILSIPEHVGLIEAVYEQMRQEAK